MVVFGRAHPCVYSDRLVSEGATRNSVLSSHPAKFWSRVKSEAENIMMAGLGGLAMEVKVYALVRNLLGVLGLQQQYESGGGSTG